MPNYTVESDLNRPQIYVRAGADGTLSIVADGISVILQPSQALVLYDFLIGFKRRTFNKEVGSRA